MFNPKFTHVGISCGCHLDEHEMCCFMYAKDPEDKPDVEKLEVIIEERFICENTETWSDDLPPGKAYKDPDDEEEEEDEDDSETY